MALKLKFRALFPASVTATSPLTLVKNGLAYVFGLDIAELRTSLDSVYVTALNGRSGPLVSYFPPQGRLTLTSATPVMGSSVGAATTVYYTPYCGNMVPIYDGTYMVPTVCAELSQTTTDTTKSPAAVGASKVYDIFGWSDNGTVRATRGPAWTNATTRGYTLTMVDGILLNTSAITNGPAALRGTYLGTIASNSGSTIDYIFGTAGSGGVAGVLNVWNAYNRVDVACQVIDTGASYTYTGATRQARGSTAMQVSFVVGLAEDAVFANYTIFAQTTAAIDGSVSYGVGFDSVTTYGQRAQFQQQTAHSVVYSAGVSAKWNPGIGSHYVSAMEASDGTNANSFNLAGSGNAYGGLSFGLRM